MPELPVRRRAELELWVHDSSGHPERLAGQWLCLLKMVFPQSDEHLAQHLVLDAVASGDHVTTADEDASTFAFPDPGGRSWYVIAS